MQAEVGVEARERADFHRGGTADPHIHWHRAEQQKTEAVGQAGGFLFQQGENAAANVSGPRRQRIGVAQLAYLVVVTHGAARSQIIQRNARLHRQRAMAGLHRADAQRAIRAGLQRHQHASAQYRLTNVGARIIGDAAHHVQPRRHARHPDFAGVEKSGKTGGVAVGLVQELLKFRNFKRQFVVH